MMPPKVWYLPHFLVVYMEKKTMTKVRIVFDCLPKIDGVSLNNAIYSGPNLKQELLDILIHFC